MTQPVSLLTDTLAPGPSVEAAIAAVADRPDPAILDSADTRRGRYTILACDPVEVISAPAAGPDPFETLRHRLEATSPRTGRPAGEHPPFSGGWIGFFAYEAGHFIEAIDLLPPDDIALPIARWGLYDSAAIYDHWTAQWTLLAADLRRTHAASDPANRIQQWRRRLDGAREISLPPAPRIRHWADNLTVVEYLRRVRRVKEYVQAGDIFQANFARRFTIRQAESPVATYLRLRRQNPAEYAAFLSWDAGRSAILSVSPELFLDVRDRHVLTRPIKGTRPRSEDPIVDASLGAELLASPKDRAELTMIIDLERNDLGRVCDFGSVGVGSPPARPTHSARNCGCPAAQVISLESHPTVHHLVATVSGRCAMAAG